MTMPVQLVVADAGTHLVFHDSSWDGTVALREGEEGAGSGHDRPGRSVLRMEGGPLRCWVAVGTPARVLLAWASLTGAPALPPVWALGHQHVPSGPGDEEEVRRLVSGFQERDLPLDAVHLGAGHLDGRRVFSVDEERFPKLGVLAEELRRDGVRLVSVVEPSVPAVPGDAVFDGGTAEDGFVREAAGPVVRGVARSGEVVYPDFTSARVRAWWGGWYEERLGRGFAGFWHDLDEPVSFTAFGERTLPRSARHSLEGRGGDHREAHNVYALCMARAAFEGLRASAPGERPFVLSRAGWAGTQRHGGVWAGDVGTGWPALRASLALVTGLGLCGVPYAGPDVAAPGARTSPELFLRWLQLAAHLPLLRTRGGWWEESGEPWESGAEAAGVAEHARAVLAERRRLLPYFVTLAHLARRTGAPYVRPLWWSSPEERALRDCEDAFLLGDCLLVAPVLEPGPTGGRCGCLAGAGTTRRRDGRTRVRRRSWSTRPWRASRCSRAGVPCFRCAVRTAGRSWRCGRPRGGGPVGAGRAGRGRRLGEPEIERYGSRWEGSRVVVEREGEDGACAPSRPVRVRGLAERSARG